MEESKAMALFTISMERFLRENLSMIRKFMGSRWKRMKIKFMLENLRRESGMDGE
jgi:hypothetical protein